MDALTCSSRAADAIAKSAAALPVRGASYRKERSSVGMNMWKHTWRGGIG